MKSIFEISKWTKKMSKMGMPKMSLLRKICAYDIEKLSSQMKLKKIFCDCKILIFFAGKKLKIFSLGDIWKL
jgi:hypothetical protein